MTATQATTIESAAALLAASPWCWKEIPLLEGSAVFELTAEQFEAAQIRLANSYLGGSLDASVAFLMSRVQELDDAAAALKASGDSYQLPVCNSRFGFEVRWHSICLWYRTSEGTILCHAVDADGSQEFLIVLPPNRLDGFDRMFIDAAMCGRTEEMGTRWHNAGMQIAEPGGYEIYAEFSQWHNANMVPLGYEAVMTAPQRLREGHINAALGNIHGEWAEKYHIGCMIAAMLGHGNGFGVVPGSPVPPADLPSAKESLRYAAAILADLKDAVQKWEGLIENLEDE